MCTWIEILINIANMVWKEYGNICSQCRDSKWKWLWVACNLVTKAFADKRKIPDWDPDEQYILFPLIFII